MRKVVDLYLKDAADQLRRLEDGLTGGDASTVMQAAHSLKSSSGNVGAQRVAELALAIECDARAGKLDAAERLLAALRQENALACEILQTHPAGSDA